MSNRERAIGYPALDPDIGGGPFPAASPDLDPRALRWSRERPTEPGWWGVTVDPLGEFDVVEAWRNADGFFLDGYSPSDPDWGDLYFAGPIAILPPLPEPPASPIGGDS